MMVTSEQLRAARALLRIDQSDLARLAQISVVTIRRVEGTDAPARVAPDTMRAVREVLEHAGAEFIPGGVRRRPVAPPHAEALFQDLRDISLRSAARLRNQELLTDADLYDDDGLPA
jgi:transcriptional regulator with XRE-family HTH domain